MTEQNFEAAFHDLQSMVLLAKDVGESPTLIRMLVGLALAHVMFQAVEYWLDGAAGPAQPVRGDAGLAAAVYY